MDAYDKHHLTEHIPASSAANTDIAALWKLVLVGAMIGSVITAAFLFGFKIMRPPPPPPAEQPAISERDQQVIDEINLLVDQIEVDAADMSDTLVVDRFRLAVIYVLTDPAEEFCGLVALHRTKDGGFGGGLIFGPEPCSTLANF